MLRSGVDQKSVDLRPTHLDQLASDKASRASARARQENAQEGGRGCQTGLHFGSDPGNQADRREILSQDGVRNSTEAVSTKRWTKAVRTKMNSSESTEDYGPRWLFSRCFLPACMEPRNRFRATAGERRPQRPPRQ